MTHEFKEIVEQAIYNQQQGITNILATVVDLDGSSYRKPGVRMLLSSDGSMTGVVSGGCVEKEIQRRAQSVFNNGKAKIITYDGRYRLGCEGILYILLEPFVVSETFLKHFIPKITSRDSFSIHSYYQKEDEYQGNIGSIILLGNKSFVFNTNWDSTTTDALCCYSQTLSPLFRLLLIGGEHDAIKLCNQAVLLGWQVDVITSIKDPKTKIDFPKANTVIAQTPELIRTEGIQQHTAVILMNHNFSYDLKYLIKLQECNPIYIGVLGAAKRREKLFNHLLEFTPEVTETFLDTIHTPAGLHIGAITPEEIALSIVAEILSVVRKKEVFPLKQITGNIHSY